MSKSKIIGIGSDPFMVMAFTGEAPEEYRPLESWPQHVTIVPWMQGHRLQAAVRISDAVRELAPVDATITSETQLSHQDVWLLEPNLALASLHQIVLAAAVKADTKLVTDQYVRENYRPHITKKSDQLSHVIGEHLTLSQLAVVGKPRNRKLVYKNIALCGSDSIKR